MRRLVLMVGLAAGGCGGGDDGGGISAIPVGAYTGTGKLTGVDVIDGARVPFASAPALTAIVAADGTYLVFSDGPTAIAQLDLGTGAVADGRYTSATNQEFGLFPDYDDNNLPVLGRDSNGTLVATAPKPGALAGTITYASANGDALEFSLALVAGSAASPTGALPATLTGTVTASASSSTSENLAAAATLAIGADGAFTGTVTCAFSSASPAPDPTPCTVTGTLVARTDVAAYDATLTFADGTGQSLPSAWVNRPATGLAYLDATGRLRIGAVAGGTLAFAFAN